jgi:hypothetical protein
MEYQYFYKEESFKCNKVEKVQIRKVSFYVKFDS